MTRKLVGIYRSGEGVPMEGHDEIAAIAGPARG
jgi:hypothetical protein